MAMFEYIKSYEKVQRTGLLTKLLNIGILFCFVEWTMAWSSNRVTEGRTDEVTPSSRGLSQGSALQSLLFVLYVGDILERFHEKTMIIAYAGFAGYRLILHWPVSLERGALWNK